MKSLRTHSNGGANKTSSTRLAHESVQQASQAASKSWQKPSKYKFEMSNTPKVEVSSYFADFDQDTYTTKG